MSVVCECVNVMLGMFSYYLLFSGIWLDCVVVQFGGCYQSYLYIIIVDNLVQLGELGEVVLLYMFVCEVVCEVVVGEIFCEVVDGLLEVMIV